MSDPGACRIPDPTTAGDLRRRRHETEHQLYGSRRATDEVQVQVWRQPQRGRGERTADGSIVDADGHVQPRYGVQEQAPSSTEARGVVSR